jgi:hypothetical protein
VTAPTPRPARRPSPRPDDDSGSGYTDDLEAVGLIRRTRVLRGIAIGLFFGAALLGLLWLGVTRGIIDIPIEWLSWIPWVDWSPP